MEELGKCFDDNIQWVVGDAKRIKIWEDK